MSKPAFWMVLVTIACCLLPSSIWVATRWPWDYHPDGPTTRQRCRCAATSLVHNVVFVLFAMLMVWVTIYFGWSCSLNHYQLIGY